MYESYVGYHESVSEGYKGYSESFLGVQLRVLDYMRVLKSTNGSFGVMRVLVGWYKVSKGYFESFRGARRGTMRVLEVYNSEFWSTYALEFSKSTIES